MLQPTRPSGHESESDSGSQDVHSSHQEYFGSDKPLSKLPARTYSLSQRSRKPMIAGSDAAIRARRLSHGRFEMTVQCSRNSESCHRRTFIQAKSLFSGCRGYLETYIRARGYRWRVRSHLCSLHRWTEHDKLLAIGYAIYYK